MSAPIKAKITNALQRLEQIDLGFETQPIAGKSPHETALRLEVSLQGIEDEIKRCIDAFSDITIGQDQWADLLRKMPRDEREEADKASAKYNEDFVKIYEQKEQQFKKLKELGRKANLNQKLAKAEAEALQKQLDKEAEQARGPIPPPAPATIAAHYSLPTLHLRKFAGQREMWPEFWEGFKAAVHNRPLEDTEKLNYLRNFLEGEARKVVEGLTLKDTNYPIALKLLREHYGDEEAYIRILYSKLSELPVCRTFEDVKTLAIDLERLTRQLEAVGQKIEEPNVFIPLEKKLTPKILREILKRKASEKTAWTTTKFRKALLNIIKEEEEIVGILREASSEKRGKEPEKFNKRGNKPEVSYTMGAIEGPRRETKGFSYAKQNKGFRQSQQINKPKTRSPCLFCGKDHWLSECTLTLDKRKAALRDKGVCFKCLGKGHFARECRRNIKCRNCNRTHPTALCPTPTNQFRGFNPKPKLAMPETKGPTPEIMCAAQSSRKALLMTTKVTVFNPREPRRSAVASIFIDGGSHRSFINKALAQELNLPVLTTEECYLAGFGEKTAKHYSCPLVQLGLLTESGDKMIYPLNSLEFIVQKMPIVELSKIEDESLRQQRLELSVHVEQPQILLGIDVFNELNIRPLEKLPNGFTISSSILGKILSGEGTLKRGENEGSLLALSFGPKEASIAGAIIYDISDEESETDDSGLEEEAVQVQELLRPNQPRRPPVAVTNIFRMRDDGYDEVVDIPHYSPEESTNPERVTQKTNLVIIPKPIRHCNCRCLLERQRGHKVACLCKLLKRSFPCACTPNGLVSQAQQSGCKPHQERSFGGPKPDDDEPPDQTNFVGALVKQCLTENPKNPENEPDSGQGQKAKDHQITSSMPFVNETPRNHWKIGVINDFKRGRNGKIRTVQIFVNKQKLERPLNRIFPLEIDAENNNNKTEVIGPIIQMSDTVSLAEEPETVKGQSAFNPFDAECLVDGEPPWGGLSPVYTTEELQEMEKDDQEWAKTQKEVYAARREERRAQGKEIGVATTESSTRRERTPVRPPPSKTRQIPKRPVRSPIRANKRPRTERESARPNNPTPLAQAIQRPLCPQAPNPTPWQPSALSTRRHPNLVGNVVLHKGEQRPVQTIPYGLTTPTRGQCPTLLELAGKTTLTQKMRKCAATTAATLIQALVINFLVRHQSKANEEEISQVSQPGPGAQSLFQAARTFFYTHQSAGQKFGWSLTHVIEVVKLWIQNCPVFRDGMTKSTSSALFVHPLHQSEDPEFDQWIRRLEKVVNSALSTIVRNAKSQTTRFMNSAEVIVIGDASAPFVRPLGAAWYEDQTWAFRPKSSLFFGPMVKHVILSFYEEMNCEKNLREILREIHTDRVSVLLHHGRKPTGNDLSELQHTARAYKADLIWTDGSVKYIQQAVRQLNLEVQQEETALAPLGPTGSMHTGDANWTPERAQPMSLALHPFGVQLIQLPATMTRNSWTAPSSSTRREWWTTPQPQWTSTVPQTQWTTMAPQTQAPPTTTTKQWKPPRRPAPYTVNQSPRRTTPFTINPSSKEEYDYPAQAQALKSEWEPRIGKIHEHATKDLSRLGVEGPIGAPLYWCSSEGSTIWEIRSQDVDPFCQEAPSIFAKWTNLTLPVYTRIKNPLPVQKAFLCTVKIERNFYYTNLFGDKFLKTETEIKIISVDQCRKMTEQLICPQADSNPKMTADSDHFWSTKNKAKIRFPGNIASIFKGEQRAEVTNCAVQSAVLYYRPHNLELVSPLYNVRHCRFQTETCILEDNSTLLWEADCRNMSCSGCDYEKLKDWPGEFTLAAKDAPATWLSRDRELALTFSDNSPRAKGCDNQNLRLSDQGYGIPKEEFQRISNRLKEKRGVREDQLAAQLTASQIQTTRAIQQLFQRECRRTNRAENPTLLARRLLKKNTLQARWLTEKELEVWSCVEVPFEQIAFRSQKTCNRYIPITVNFKDRKVALKAFLDPILRIISSTSAEADCLHFRFHLIEKGPGIWLRIDTRNAEISIVPPSSIYQIYETVPDKTGGILDLKPLIFHEMILANDSEIFTHVDELLRFQNWKTKVSQEQSSKATTLGALPYGLKGMALEIWAYYWSILKENWMLVACTYATFLLITEVVIPLVAVYLLGPALQFVGRIANPSNRNWRRTNLGPSRGRKAKRRKPNRTKEEDEVENELTSIELPNRNSPLNSQQLQMPAAGTWKMRRAQALLRPMRDDDQGPTILRRHTMLEDGNDQEGTPHRPTDTKKEFEEGPFARAARPNSDFARE